MYKSAVVIGSDSKQEWMIPWFMFFYKQYNSYPLVICDFGDMSNIAKDFAKRNAHYIILKEKLKNIWLNKAIAIENTPSENVVWLDMDCQVKGNLKPLFKYCDGFGCCIERNTKKMPNGERLWGEWQGGVIATNTKNEILKSWAYECRKDEEIIDQYVLTQVCKKNKFTITKMPEIFNWRYRMGPNDKCLIKHFAAPNRRKVKAMKKEKEIDFTFDFTSIKTDENDGIKL